MEKIRKVFVKFLVVIIAYAKSASASSSWTSAFVHYCSVSCLMVEAGGASFADHASGGCALCAGGDGGACAHVLCVGFSCVLCVGFSCVGKEEVKLLMPQS